MPASSQPVLIARLFRIEVGRMARRWSFWAGVMALAFISWSSMVQGFQGVPIGRKLFGTFSYLAVRDNLVILIPVFVGVVVAGSLAADRRRRYLSLVLVRGISRVRYLFVKAAAMTFVAGSGAFLSFVLAFLGAALLIPWGPTTVRGSRGPYPELLMSHPFANDLVFMLLLSLGAAALALSGLVFGAVVANEYVAAAVPFVLVFGSLFLLRGPLTFLGPYTQLDLLQSYTYFLPRWAWSFTAPVYWLVFILTCVAIAAAIFVKKEEI